MGKSAKLLVVALAIGLLIASNAIAQRSSPNLPEGKTVPAPDTEHQLALLVASSFAGESEMRDETHNDIVAIGDGLRQRGFSPQEIAVLEGAPLTRQSLTEFLRAAGRRVSHWQSGKVFFYFAGHGNYVGRRVGLQLADDPGDEEGRPSRSLMFWDEALASLDLPAGIQLFLLPDS